MKGSGTCNVCAAPCSSCMHINQDISFMESKAEGGGYSENSCGGKGAENCLLSDAETPVYKSKQCEPSVGMLLKVTSFETDEDNQLVENKPLNSSMPLKTFSIPRGGHASSECLGDNISCVTIRTDRNISTDNMCREETPCTSASALCSDATLSVKNENSVALEEPPSKEQVTNDDKNGHECNRFSKGGVNAKYEISEDNDDITQESKTVPLKDNLTDGSNENVSSNEQLEMKTSSTGKSISQEYQLNLRKISEDNYSAPEILEDDVKVCDICGDAGREDLLAICSRCSDGAEHTYCMRVMLDKLPEGDWLCEECSMKDLQASKAEKTETPSESNQKPGFSIGLQSSDTSTKRPLEKSEISSLPSKKSVLSRESSSKSLDSGKIKSINNSALPSNGPVVSHPLAPTPTSSKTQGQRIQPSRGLLSRSGSVTGLKPKVKQFTESILQKPKEPSSGDRKEGVPRTLSKSLSLKSVNPAVVSSSESTSKSQSAILQRQNKERAIERKNSFVQNRVFSSISSETDPKTTTVNSTQEQSVSLSNEASEDVSDKAKELKKQASSKNLGSSTGNEGATQVVIKEDTRLCPSGDIKTEKVKDSSTFATSRQLAPPPKRIVRCQKCNETGHSTQFCSIDKVRISALKPSTEKCSRESITTKSNKWKDAVDFAISKGRAQKSLPDRSEDISGNEAGPTSSSVSLSNPASTREGEPNASSTQVEDQKQTILDASRISALPQHDYIWQGSFELKRSGGLPEICEGFQAHLSTRASPKVPEVVTKFPDKVTLEEVNRLSSWPLQFKEKGPAEENIALFFFARDIKSYEKAYKNLLERMLKNDFALRGNFEGIELLVFPSNKLPERSQRWNRLFFLWGVFRERRPSLPEVKVNVNTKPTVLDLDLERPPEDLPSAEEPVVDIPPLKTELEALTREDSAVNAIAETIGSLPQRSMPENNPGPSRPAEEKARNGPSQEEFSAPGSSSRPRSSPWPPDLNLESQDTDDEPAETRDSNNNNTSMWRLSLEEKKRARSHSPFPWRAGTTEGDEAEKKRTRFLNPDTISVTSDVFTATAGGAGGSKVHPLLGSFEDEWRKVAAPEQHLFPLGSGSLAARRPEELPDLELALGAEKRRLGMKGILPLPFTAAAAKSWKIDNDADDDEDDLASLSLSLAFPFSSNKQPPPPTMKQPPSGKSFLFDRFRQG